MVKRPTVAPAHRSCLLVGRLRGCSCCSIWCSSLRGEVCSITRARSSYEFFALTSSALSQNLSRFPLRCAASSGKPPASATCASAFSTLPFMPRKLTMAFRFFRRHSLRRLSARDRCEVLSDGRAGVLHAASSRRVTFAAYSRKGAQSRDCIALSEVRRITLLRRWVNKGNKKGRSYDARPF